MKKKGIRRVTLIISIIGMIAGLLVLLYPLLMDMYNDHKNEMAISSMSSIYDRYGENAERIEKEFQEADAYNARLAGNYDGSAAIPDYEEQLDFDGNGIMGYVEIPEISLKMLVYHGTGDDVLAIGAGHLEGTSLPVGGNSTHSIITAHSGMKTMRAFDDLRKLKVGDMFSVSVLGKTCTYEVDSIDVVLPYETDTLEIIPGEDRVTLVTCTPYGVNDHRLLVHGLRVADVPPEIKTEENMETGETENMTEQNENAESSFWQGLKQNITDMRKMPVIVAVLISAGAVTAVMIGGRKGKEK